MAVGLLKIPYFGNEDGVMDKNGKTGRRYSAEEKAVAVRMVRTLRVRTWDRSGDSITGRIATGLWGRISEVVGEAS
jgi:hypothetical protein